MEIILLETVRNLGVLGEKVKVKAGYGRNFLIPQGKAAYATEENLKKFEARRSELEKIAAGVLAAAQKKKAELENLKIVTISAKAGEEGKLFGSVGTRDIADAITKAGISVNKSEVILATGAIRNVGEYDIMIELHGEVNANIKLQIVAET